MDARGKRLNCILRGNGHYSPVWMWVENLIALSEETVTMLLCRCGRKTTCFHSKRNLVLLSHAGVGGGLLSCTLRGNGHYSPVWMWEENNLIALLEEIVTTLLCRCGRKAACFHSKRNWVLLSHSSVGGGLLSRTLRGNGHYSPVWMWEGNSLITLLQEMGITLPCGN